MKKLLLALIALMSMNIAIAQNCTADPQFTAPGVYPDSATGLSVAVVGTPYNETITTITPVDTVYLGFTVPVDSVVIDSISGLPAGFSMVSEFQNGLNFIFPGGSTSCMLITGTATAGQVGSYPIYVSGLSWGTFLGSSTSLPFVVDYYTIEIVLPTSVDEFSKNTFEVKQNRPNPTGDLSIVEYYLPEANQVTISVFNLLGKVIKSENVNGATGSNKYNLDASNLTNGIYFYSLTYANKTVTKRFVVNK